MKTGTQLLFFFIVIFLFIARCINAFELPQSLEIYNADDVYQLLEDEFITTEVAELLLELLENPIDLNRADADELFSLPGITQADAESLVQTRKQLHGFKRWDDLLRVLDFSREKLKQLETFAYIRPPVDRSDGRAELSVSETANDGKAYYARAKMRADVDERIFWGLSSIREDDAAYRWRKSIVIDPPGWRLDKFYVEWRSKGVVNQIVVGNYTAGFGAGLVFNDAHRFIPKGLYMDDTLSRNRQRGIAVSLSWKPIRQTIFMSALDYPTILPPQATGLKWQRTINDIYTERLLGTNISFNLPRSSNIGFTWYRSIIDKHLDAEFLNLPNKERWGAYGLYFSTVVNDVYLRGEVSQMENPSEEEPVDFGRAMYLELSTKYKSADFLASLRRYDMEFQNPHSRGFADADDSHSKDIDGDIDEIGVYMRLRYIPTAQIHIRAYYDQWQHPSTHLADNEAYIELEYRPIRLIRLGISSKWDDNDLSIHGDERVGSLFWTQLRPSRALRFTTVYRWFRIRKTAITYDDYAYLKIEWFPREWLEFEARWKINDTQLTDGDTFPKEGYLQLQIWNKLGWAGRFRYTRRHYGVSSRVTPNPKHIMFLKLEYKW